MLKIKIRITGREWILLVVFYVLLLQPALEGILPVFSYVDELFALFGIMLVMYQGMRKGKLWIKKSSLRILLTYLIFLAAGLLGNLIFQYQPLTAVLTDLYINMKFFLSIISGYVIFRIYELQREHDFVATQARLAAAIFFVFVLLDQFFQVFPSQETRYGIRVTQLMYGHATYLAGAVVFLLSVLTAFYQKKNNYYIIMCLLVLFFTLRGKAIAGAAIYCVIFYFIVIYQKKIKAWHIAIIVLVAIAIGGEQFAFYYLELEGKSARSVMTQTSIEILRDYFPIGTGFGTYASHSAAEYYSPVYVKYGFLDIYELGGSSNSFYDDTFWPIIIGQTGAIGTLAYLAVIGMIFVRILKTRSVSIYAYATGFFIFSYLMISSTSEPTFNNSISVPLAMMLGYILTLENKFQKETEK